MRYGRYRGLSDHRWLGMPELRQARSSSVQSSFKRNAKLCSREKVLGTLQNSSIVQAMSAPLRKFSPASIVPSRLAMMPSTERRYPAICCLRPRSTRHHPVSITSSQESRRAAVSCVLLTAESFIGPATTGYYSRFRTPCFVELIQPRDMIQSAQAPGTGTVYFRAAHALPEP
jgi:hypothetical protein